MLPYLLFISKFNLFILLIMKLSLIKLLYKFQHIFNKFLIFLTQFNNSFLLYHYLLIHNDYILLSFIYQFTAGNTLFSNTFETYLKKS